MAQVSGVQSQLGRDEFLKLLTTQLRNQNPLDPIKDADFVAQLAQFSSLEGIEKLNANFEQMLQIQQLTQGANLVGRTVVYQPTGSTDPQRGVVGAVSVLDGQIQLLVGGAAVPLSQIRGFA